MKKQEPIHPGKILLGEFLLPMKISQSRLAKEINISTQTINEIVRKKRSITPNTALPLSLYFGLSERFWFNLQSRYDLETEKDKLGDHLRREVRVLATI